MLKKKIKFFKPNLRISEKLAIVGSSASILKKKNGVKIDQYDEIIRFNNSKIQNYEEYVGTKTTIRVVNNPTFECANMWNNEDEDRYFVKKLRNINIAVISPYKIESHFKEENCSDKNNYFFFRE